MRHREKWQAYPQPKHDTTVCNQINPGWLTAVKPMATDGAEVREKM